MSSKESKQFDFETMSVVLYAMLESGITLGNKHFDMMAAVDPLGRSASSFQHQFRSPKARAKELQEQAKNGTFGTPNKKATPKPKGSAKSSSKRGRKALEEDGDDDDETPSKKGKVKQEALAEEDYDEV